MPRKKAQSVKAMEKPSGENEGTESLLHAQDHEATSAHKKANLKRATESTVDLIVPTGPRQAKVDALDNAVWKQLAPGASYKRRESMTGATPEAVRLGGKKRKRENDINIPVPSAPKKAVKTVKQASSKKKQNVIVLAPSKTDAPAPSAPKKAKKTVGQASSKEIASNVPSHLRVATFNAFSDSENIIIPAPSVPTMARTPVIRASSTKRPAASRNKANDDNEDCESSVTESDVPWPEDEEVRSDESITEDEDVDEANATDANVKGNNRTAKLTAAEKRFMAEQAFWSDEENLPPPGTSSTTVPTFVIKGDLIEISDDDNGADDSPTAQLVSVTSPVIKREPLQSSNTPNSLAVVNVAPALQGTTSPRWPQYTNIIMSPESKEIQLSIQGYELKLVVRKAITLIEYCVRFEHAFPTLEDRKMWNRSALQEGCTWSESISHSTDIKLKYAAIKQRIEADDQYFIEVSTILQPRVSLLRSNMKAAAIINARTAYGLHSGSVRLVQRLLQQKQYIYLPAPQGEGILNNRPFEHAAIIGTLHDELFGGSRSILRLYPDRFKAGEEETYTLTPSMIALAATAVFAVLKEWETGPRIPMHFTMNMFAEIYRGHVEDLEYIKQQNEPAYNSLLRRLFLMASGFGNNPFNNAVIDVDNMAVDV